MNSPKILISHRGNLNGPEPRYENTIPYIQRAMKEGFDVEIDLRYEEGSWYLGHDQADTIIGEDFLIENKKRLWCHAKDPNALKKLLDIQTTCFWHQDDYYTLTSNGYIWTYPGHLLVEKSICVLPENCNILKNIQCAGICSDFIENYRDKEYQ